METLERYSQNQRIVDEFTAHWLAPIANDLGRLVYIAMLRDVSTGHYTHSGLERNFSPAAVHHALAFCHKELFERFLEAPLEIQEKYLRQWFAMIESPPAEIATRWLEAEFFRILVPQESPAYLRDLLFSNLRVILALVASEKPLAQAQTKS